MGSHARMVGSPLKLSTFIERQPKKTDALEPLANFSLV